MTSAPSVPTDGADAFERLSFGRGGVEMTFTREVDPATGVAGTELVLAAVDDGSLFRFFGTWGPPG